MKICGVTVVLFLLFSVVYGQVGFSAYYTSNNAPEWETQFTDENGAPIGALSIGDGWNLGIDYWFRLPNQRIEFMPEFNFGAYQHSEGQAAFNNQFYSFFFNTNFYLFDLNNDCDCPTFSKENDLLKKGFFLRISPGISHHRSEYTIGDFADNDENWNFSIGGALGVDVGISDLLTLTPIVGLRYFPEISWAFEEAENNSSLTQVQAGIRIGFRLDEQ